MQRDTHHDWEILRGGAANRLRGENRLKGLSAYAGFANTELRINTSGAGEWNRTTDLRFTKQARTISETLGVSNGFPVLSAKTGTCVHSIDSIVSRCIGGF